MCGRYTLRNPAALAEAFELEALPALAPRYNIAPSQEVPIIRFTPTGRRLELARWGLIPAWAREPAGGYATINARAETVDTKPSFRGPFRRQRCIVPADGFYEWQAAGGVKIPHYIVRPDGAPFALAGLWDRWQGPQGEVLSCTVIVTAANRFMRRLHERMPLILAPEDYARWLDPDNRDSAGLKRLLAPAPEDLLIAWPVSRRVNDPRHDAPDCIQPVSGERRHP